MKAVLEQLVGCGNVACGEPMSAHTTFRVGGPADYFVAPATAEQVAGVVNACRERDVDLFVIGCGSNLLVSDAGLRGVVMQVGSQLGNVEIGEDGAVTAQAGATNARVARAACQAGLAGLEFAAGIPGSIGGAAIMNAGAYGGELKDVATSATCLGADGSIRKLDAAEAGWGYRCSSMEKDGSVVLSVDFKLQLDDPTAIEERMADLARRRLEKQPLDKPSAGSTFKRPPGQFAGKLIQDAGMQGHTVGGAQVSEKHAGFVVNVGGATASDIRQVIQDVQEAVLARFGVELEPEVRCWGF